MRRRESHGSRRLSQRGVETPWRRHVCPRPCRGREGNRFSLLPEGPSLSFAASPLCARGGRESRACMQMRRKRRELFARGKRHASHAAGVDAHRTAGTPGSTSAETRRRKGRNGIGENTSEEEEGDEEEGEEEEGEEEEREAEEAGEDAGEVSDEDGEEKGEEDGEEEGDEDGEEEGDEDGEEEGDQGGEEEASDYGDDLFSSCAFSQMEGVLHTRLIRTLNHHGFRRLTAIQHLTIPTVLHGHDTLVQCFTGSGKTLCFVVPLLQQLLAEHERTGKSLKRGDGTRGLLLMPTRELAVQACSQISRLAQLFPWIVVAAITGGEKKQSEKRRLRAGVTVLLGTPGRVLDHLTTTSCFEVSALHLLVLDEADRLLDLGFEAKLKKIVTLLAEKKAEQLQMKALRLQLLEEQNPEREEEGLGREAHADGSSEDDGEASGNKVEASSAEKKRKKGEKGASAAAESSSASAAALSRRGEEFQVIMASATLTPQVERLAAFCLRQEPQWVSLDRYREPLLARLSLTTAEEPEKPQATPRSLSGFPCCCALSPATCASSAQTSEGEAQDSHASADTRFHVPAQLRQYYLQLSSPRLRLLPLLALLLQVAKTGKGKAIVFLSCCDAVEHFHALLQRLRWPGPIVDREQRKRQKERIALMRRIRGDAGREAFRRATRHLERSQRRSKRQSAEDDASDGQSDLDEEEEDEDGEEEGDELLGEPVLSGVSLFKLHGQMGRDDRLGYLKEFSEAPGAAVLFATDVAARGLNLPYVTWIAQFDLPQQIEEYVHRIGRTARLGKEGNALIFLLDCERGYAEYLRQRGFSSLQEMDEARMLDTLFDSHMPNYLRHLESPTSFLVKQFATFVAERPSLLQTARRAFLGTLRALRCLGKDARAVCSHASLHTGHLATSFGLNEAPREAAMRLKTGEHSAPPSGGKSGGPGGRQSRSKKSRVVGSPGFASKAKHSKTPPHPRRSFSSGFREQSGEKPREETSEIEVVPAKQAQQTDRFSGAKTKDLEAARATQHLRAKGDLLRVSGIGKKKNFNSKGERKRPRLDAADGGARAKKTRRDDASGKPRNGIGGKPGRHAKMPGVQTSRGKGGGSQERRIRNLSQSEFG
ncbi:UNVERIFIED_CONTAM: DEAD/DEAH box helicase domain-containing protein [Hammondia hammondi]|eukprot:XP_008888318.1 DEAD/DEAH box helicase domain-containing protein [Hammondia hammondi]